MSLQLTVNKPSASLDGYFCIIYFYFLQLFHLLTSFPITVSMATKIFSIFNCVWELATKCLWEHDCEQTPNKDHHSEQYQWETFTTELVKKQELRGNNSSNSGPESTAPHSNISTKFKFKLVTLRHKINVQNQAIYFSCNLSSIVFLCFVVVKRPSQNKVMSSCSIT